MTKMELDLYEAMSALLLKLDVEIRRGNIRDWGDEYPHEFAHAKQAMAIYRENFEKELF